MYSRIVLAYDGTREGRTALREGALLAKGCAAQVFLLSVIGDTAGVQIGESALPGAVDRQRDTYRSILQEGLERLEAVGFRDPVARLVEGEPARVIAAFAREVQADLVVVGHRRQSAFARWWAGSANANLLEYLGCSILVSRKAISDEDFNSAFARRGGAPPESA